MAFVAALAVAAALTGYRAAAVGRPTDAAAASGGILVSRQLARDAHLGRGDTIVVAADPAGTRALRVRIDGVYEPTPDPMKFTMERLEARLHLPDLVSLTSDPADPLSAEAATAINLKLRNPADASAFAADLAARSMGLSALPTARARQGDPFAILERFHAAIAAVTVIGSTAFLLALMVMRAEERRETVGVLRLIGVSRRTILLQVVVEGMLVALAGALFGVALATGAQFAVNRIFQARYDTALVFVRVTPRIAAQCVVVAVPAGVLAGVVASWTLLRRRPALLVRR